MSNLVRASVTIYGTRPFLFHAFGPDAIPLEKQERTGVAGNDPEEWKKTVLVAKDGRLYVEPTYIFGSIRDGAKYTRKGKGSIQAAVSATLQVLDQRCYFNLEMPDQITRDEEQPVYLDVRSVRNPSTKGRNVRYRVALASNWWLGFHIMFDKTVVSRPEIQAALRDAGTLCGIGDGRSIGFGRFSVHAFTELDD